MGHSSYCSARSGSYSVKSPSPQRKSSAAREAISTATLPLAARALDSLDQLRDCEAHSSVILSAADSSTYARLGLRLTSTPKYQSNQQLYHK